MQDSILPVLVNAKNVDAIGIISNRVATVPNLVSTLAATEYLMHEGLGLAAIPHECVTMHGYTSWRVA